METYDIPDLRSKEFSRATNNNTRIYVSALEEAKRIARKHHDVGMEDPLNLALRLKKYHRA